MLDENLEPDVKMTKNQILIIHLNKLSILLKKGRIPEAHKALKEI